LACFGALASSVPLAKLRARLANAAQVPEAQLKIVMPDGHLPVDLQTTLGELLDLGTGEARENECGALLKEGAQKQLSIEDARSRPPTERGHMRPGSQGQGRPGSQSSRRPGSQGRQMPQRPGKMAWLESADVARPASQGSGRPGSEASSRPTSQRVRRPVSDCWARAPARPLSRPQSTLPPRLADSSPRGGPWGCGSAWMGGSVGTMRVDNPKRHAESHAQESELPEYLRRIDKPLLLDWWPSIPGRRPRSVRPCTG